MKMTKAQTAALEYMAHTSLDGMCARNNAQENMFIRMQEQKLVKFVGYGFCDEYGWPEREFPIYAITASGRKLIEKLGLL